MANPSYGKKSLREDEDKVTGLVDYSSSSEDENSAPLLKKRCLSDSGSDPSLSDYASEDENPAPVLKKQHLSDSGSDGNGSSNFDSKEEDKMKECWQSKTVFNDTLSDIESDEDDDWYDTDYDVLWRGPYSWRKADRWNGKEVYCLNLAGKAPREESKCLELLDEIGCRERYLGCSVEMERVFFANLNKDEAARMQGLEGIHQVIPRRLTVFDV